MIASCPKWRISLFLRHETKTMIGMLVFPDFQLLDAAGPISVFDIAGRFAGVRPSIKLLAETPGPVRSSSGVEMLARGLKAAGAINTPIVAGGEGGGGAAGVPENGPLLRAMGKPGGWIGPVLSRAPIS